MSTHAESIGAGDLVIVVGCHCDKCAVMLGQIFTVAVRHEDAQFRCGLDFIGLRGPGVIFVEKVSGYVLGMPVAWVRKIKPLPVEIKREEEAIA